MQKTLIAYPDKCAGCRACEAVCSLVKEGEISPTASRIHVVRREWVGLYVQAICQQCDPPICRSVCPSSAISRNEKTGAMLVDSEKCTLCNACVKACPFGAVHVDNDQKAVIVCDLCDGEPECVEWCPHEALKYLHLDLLERRRIMDRILELMKITGYKTKVVVVRR